MWHERGVVDVVIHIAVAITVDTRLIDLKPFALRVGCAVL
eukprot:COSAG02_NODE_46693_length_347_cov_0.463710_1_plen_39_part_10